MGVVSEGIGDAGNGGADDGSADGVPTTSEAMATTTAMER